MMQTFSKKEALIASVILFLTLGTVSPQFRLISLRLSPVLAQVSPEEFEVPESVPRGTTVRLDGSSSMAKVNQALKERFEQQYPNSDVQLNAAGSTAALEALVNEEIDLAAIGRPLTAVEKAQGLVQIPLSRQKIAILVGPNSPYRDIDITFEQFSRIFRGEITDWSELGGELGPIQLIDRPDYSDTRQAFQRYDVFKAAPFRTGANTTQVDRDSTDTVIEELGKNAGGIGYAIADQVFDRQDVTIIPMHKVFPDDERYPFSQSLSYVYKEPATPAVEAFIGYALDPSNQQAVKEAVAETTTEPEDAIEEPAAAAQLAQAPNAPDSPDSPEPAAAPGDVDQVDVDAQATPPGLIPWWVPLLLALSFLAGGFLVWLLKNRDDDDERPKRSPFGEGIATNGTPINTAGAAVPPPTPVAAPVPAPAPAPAPAPVHSSLHLVPYDGKNAYAYWDVAPAHIQNLQRQGGKDLVVRLYDVTDSLISPHQPPYLLQQFSCEPQPPYILLTLPAENRDYMAELGYLTPGGEWLLLATSNKVRVSPTIPTSTAVTATPNTQAWLAPSPYPATTPSAMTAPPAPSGYGGGYYPPAPAHSRLFLVPYDGKNAYTYWDIAPVQAQSLQRLGGEKLMLRLYDVTDSPNPERDQPPMLQQFGCQGEQNYLLLSLPAENRDYLVELGYLTREGYWLPLTRSQTVRVTPIFGTGNVLPGGIGHGEGTWLSHSPNPSHSRLFLVPYSGKNAYAYWELVPNQIQALKHQGGEKLLLRLYDVSDSLDPDSYRSHCVQEYDCQGSENYVLLTFPSADQDYLAELGYLTATGDWLPLTDSETVRVTTNIPTDSDTLFLVSRDRNNSYTYLEVPPTVLEALKHKA